MTGGSIVIRAVRPSMVSLFVLVAMTVLASSSFSNMAQGINVPVNLTADGTVVQYTTSENSSAVFSISAAQVRSSSGTPVAYVDIWVSSAFFDAKNPPQFLIQQNSIPIPRSANQNATALNYFVKKSNNGAWTLLQLVAPLTPNQQTFIGVYFSYSMSNNTNSTNGGNSTNPINGGNSTNPINGGNSTNPTGGNSTNPINGGNSTNPTGGNSTNPINGGNSTNPTGGNSTNPTGGNSTNPINGGNSTNPTGGNSTNPINGGNSTTNDTTMFKVGVTGPISFNISAWITSDRGVPLPTTNLAAPVGGSLQPGKFQYFNFNVSMGTNHGLYVAVTANTPNADGLQIFLSVNKYATLDNFDFQATFTKQFATNYVTYALLTDDQLPASGRFSVLVYSDSTALDFIFVCLAPAETELAVGVNSTWSIDKNSFSIANFALPAAVVAGPSPLLLQFDTPSPASAFNTKVYLAYQRLATQYDFDYSLSTADNVNASSASSRYLVLQDSDVKSGVWYIAVYTNGAATQISAVVSLPGDAPITISDSGDASVTTEIGSSLWGVFHFNPQSLSNSSSTKEFLQFSVSSSALSSIMALFSSSSSNFTIYGRYGAVPTPLTYDSISQVNKDEDQVLCSNTKSFPTNQNGTYYIAIVNHASTTMQFSVSVTNTNNCPSSSSKGGVVITIIAIILAVATAIAVTAYILKKRQAKPAPKDYRLLQQP